jgi:hypothetical protein
VLDEVCLLPEPDPQEQPGGRVVLGVGYGGRAVLADLTGLECVDVITFRIWNPQRRTRTAPTSEETRNQA